MRRPLDTPDGSRASSRPRPAAAALASHARSAGAVDRAIWLTLAGLALAVLGLAAMLSPDPAGHGTHTQLGLPPCAFLAFTGLPCPACGLTTAFSHLIRGDISLALAAQPMGLVLFGLTVAGAVVSMGAAAGGWSFARVCELLQVQRILVVAALLTAITWCWRLATIWLS